MNWTRRGNLKRKTLSSLILIGLFTGLVLAAGTSSPLFFFQTTPSVSSISPTSVAPGSFSLTINGSNFNTSTAQIIVTGPNCPTTTSCVVPNGVLTTKTSTKLVGPLTINTTGTFTIQVQNGSGGPISNGATLTVTSNPTPSISSISPSSVTAGTFSLTINGSNFNTSNVQIVVTGPNCPTTSSCVVPNGVLTSKSSTQIVGPVTITTAGSFTIQVQNGSGGTLSNGAPLTVSASNPSISSISPSTVTAGTFSLTINGSNFSTSNVQIVVTGPNCPTTSSCVVPNGVLTSKSSTQIVGPVTITTPGSFTIQVQNGSGGTLSNGAPLTVNASNPSISSISPSTVTAGTFSLTINGSNFNTSNVQIVVTGPNCPTTSSCVVPNGVLTSKSSTQIVGPVTITTPGSFTIQVQNGSGGTLSNGAPLTVNASNPSISSISPSTVTAGTFSLTINGSNFNTSNVQIVVTGPNCPTTSSCVVPNGVLTSKSSTQIVGPVTITTAGSFTIQVQNGSGGTLSNGAPLTVNASNPSISSISPSTVTAGTFSLTINGSNFSTSNVQIVVTGPNCPTTSSCVVPNGVLTSKSSTQITGPITINVAGSFTIKVQNGSGGTLSNGAPLTVNASPAPSITSISPTTPASDSNDQNVTVFGANFQQNLNVTATFPGGGSALLSGTQIQNVTPNSFVMRITLGATGTWSIRVNNPDGTHSNDFSFAVANGAQNPAVTAIDPSVVSAGSTDQDVTVVGNNFQSNLNVIVTFPSGGTSTLSGAQIRNVSATSFIMRITANAAGSWKLRVVNPDGAQGNNFNFTVVTVSDLPTISSINPATPNTSGADQDVIVNGSNLQSGLRVNVIFPSGGGATLQGTGQIQNVSSNSLTMRITLNASGQWSIRAVNADGRQSGLFSFNVQSSGASPTGLPTSVLSPVIGPLRVTGSNLHIADGRWEFDQHKTGNHVPGGGISASDDTNAWDVNQYTPTSGNADAGQPVFSTADGEVISYVGTAPGSGPGAVLVAHPNASHPVWFSGYLHMTHVRVSLNQLVNQATVLGEIGSVGASNDHLHFVVYSGENTRGNLRSFNPTIVERNGNSATAPTIGLITPNTVTQSNEPQLIKIDGANFDANSIVQAQDPNGRFFTIAPESVSAASNEGTIIDVSSNTINFRLPFVFAGTYQFAVINNGKNSSSTTAKVSDSPAISSSASCATCNVLSVPGSMRTPVIFIPGFMGSRLAKREGGGLRNLWLGGALADQRDANHRELAKSVENPDDYRDISQRVIVATDLVRNLNIGTLTLPLSDVYDRLMNYLMNDLGYTQYDVTDPDERTRGGCDETQRGADLFVFPYDWRNSNKTSARDLFEYVQCIKAIRGNPSDFKVDIVAHSMGGLVARRYILDNPSNNYVDRMLTLGTPWLGAPKVINVMETGDYDWKSINMIIPKETLKAIAPYIMGAHELIPSKAYTDDLSGDDFGQFPFGEDGWDFDGSRQIEHKYAFDALKKAVNDHYPPNAPGTTTESFHTRLQDNWSFDNQDISYYQFVGHNQNTITSLIAKKDTSGRERLETVETNDGDGTVPLVSATRVGKQDYSGNVKVEVMFGLKHSALASDPVVFPFIKCVIRSQNADACLTSPSNAKAVDERIAAESSTSYLVKVIGSQSVLISDSFGNTSAPLSNSLEQGLPTVETNVTGNDYVSSAFPADQNYRIVFKSSGAPLSVIITRTDGQIVSEAIRYVDVALRQNASASIDITPKGVGPFQVDSDGDGVVETVINPTVTISGAPAQDLEVPNISFTEVVSANSLVTITAADAGSGVKSIFYSLDGRSYQPYTTTLNLNATETPIVYAFADDNVGNRSGVATFQLSPAVTLQFASSTFATNEGDGVASITVNRVGNSSGPATIDYSTSDGSGSQKKDYFLTAGTLRFAPGETAKSFNILLLDNGFVDGDRTVNINLSNPSGAALGLVGTATLTIHDNDTSLPATNPIDTPEFLVQQTYLDFLNRQPDKSGRDFWTNDISSCGIDSQCVDVHRINVSAAFFLSIEFQQTGYLVERLYKSAFGDATGNSTIGGTHQLPVPKVRFSDFLRDTQRIGEGVVVLAPGWEQLLETNKQAFANEFVARSPFVSAFPVNMSADQLVDKLNANAGNPLSTLERNQLVNDLATGTKTRAQVLRVVAEHQNLVRSEFNRAFVLMQYFGYLRRDPNSGPDADYSGYDFWLGKLNDFNGSFINAEMVKAFITSREYRQRFAP